MRTALCWYRFWRSNNRVNSLCYFKNFDLSFRPQDVVMVPGIETAIRKIARVEHAPDED